jgi:pyruvate,water dikinase
VFASALENDGQMSKKFIYWLDELTEEQSSVVGGKSANIGRMLSLGVSVPLGFAISADAHRRFMEATGLLQQASRFLELRQLNKVGQLTEASLSLRKMVEEREIPEDLKKEVAMAYQALCAKTGIAEVPVAVRSSGIAEDSAAASYAGQFDSYLNVRGEQELLEKLKKAWSSAFTARVLAYRMKKGIPAIEEIGVCVLKMVRARCAGIAFTTDPNTGDISKIIVEANWGLGESVVGGGAGGRVIPDRWILDKDTLEIREHSLGTKERRVVFKESGTCEEETSTEDKLRFCLIEGEVREIGRLAKLLESYYILPQDVEWAIDQETNDLLFVQTRPVIISTKDATDQAIDLMLSRYIY